MNIYLVGGAVRDELLQLPVVDQDWVVVGGTPQQLIDQGYKPVGKDFPVFLHPESKQEYALARTETKQGEGYTGFECYFAPDVSLEDDLKRRDLTINAIAKDPETGAYIDPYNGQQDLKDRYLRHVSPAFVEDPLRVLRVARFAARFAHLGFRVHPETNHFMYRLVRSGELNKLSAERIWLELHKALETQSPHIFLRVLRECGALKALFPEIDALYGVPATTLWHPEIDSGVHLEMVLAAAAELSSDPQVRFAALLHDLGKGITYRQKWPKHHGHDERGVALVEDFCKRWRVPKKYTELAAVVCQYHGQLHRIHDHLTPKALVGLLTRTGAYRFPERFAQFCEACEADHRGRLGFSNKPYQQRRTVEDALAATNSVDVQAIIAQGFEGAAIQQQVERKRLEFMTQFCETLG